MKNILSNIVNVGSHVGIGIWAGQGLNSDKYRTGTLALSAGFLAYQIMGMIRKKDDGDLQIKEYLLGLAASLAYNRAKDWYDSNKK